MRAAAAALVACIPLAFPSTAPADDAAARGHFCDRARTETDPARLFLAADECLRGSDPGKVAAARDRALKQLEAGEYAPIDIEVDPPEAQVTIAALGADPFSAPRTVWLPYGPHEIRATAPGRTGAAVTIRLGSRAPGPPVRLTLPVAVDAGPGEAAVDFVDEGTAGDVETSSDLPQAKHDELLKDKYRKGLAARGDVERAAPPPRYGAGLRFGTGLMLINNAAGFPNDRAAWLLRAGLKARYGLTGHIGVEIEPAAQLMVTSDPVVSLSVPLMARFAALRVGPALNVYHTDGNNHLEVAAAAAVVLWRHWEARFEAGLNEVGDGARMFAFVLHWDSGG